MFGLFRRNNDKPSVTENDKEWVETNIAWLIKAFGLEKLKEKTFYLLTKEEFPYDNIHDPVQFENLCVQLCKSWDVNREQITIRVFDDVRSKKWNNLQPLGQLDEPGGVFFENDPKFQKSYSIHLAKSNFDDLERLVFFLAHEIAHVKLMGDNYLTYDNPDLEPLTDLTLIFSGYGIIYANCSVREVSYWLSKAGYLPAQIISYANALLCYISGDDAKKYYPFLNTNTRELFQQDYEYLINTNDTKLSPKVVEDCNEEFEANQKGYRGLATHNFQDSVDGFSRMLEFNPKNNYAYNNLGYAQLMMKRYEEAIDNFTKAIEIDPFWSYPINNRGYCLLQLNDLENAYTDLTCSFDMEPDNSFSWRNLGAFALKTGEYQKALELFQGAFNIDPKTEMINFYLSKVYDKLGDVEKSNEYKKLSIELKEHNDSMLDDI